MPPSEHDARYCRLSQRLNFLRHHRSRVSRRPEDERPRFSWKQASVPPLVAERPIESAHWNSLRYIVGVQPVVFRNVLLKELVCAYPKLRAISVTELVRFAKSVFATSMRRCT